MQMKKGDIIEFVVDSLAFGGQGIGRHEGRAVFVKGVMPGDKVSASLRRIKPNFLETDLVEVLEKSKNRIEPECKHFEECGGCQFQFMSYEDQLKVKKQFVIDAFERIGGLRNVEVKDVVGADNGYFYRNKMEFSFGYDVDFNFTLGFHVPGRKFDILDVEECHLESLESVAVVNATREVMKSLDWKPFKYSDGEGFLKHLVIREGKRTGEVLINLVTSHQVPDDLEDGLSKFVETIKSLDFGDKKLVSICWTQKIAKRGTPTRFEESVLWGEKVLKENMILENGEELKFEIAPRAFFQVNTLQAEKLYSEVVKLAGDSSGIAFDLFCGTGTIGLFLAKHVEQIYGIEINEEAVKSARKNAQKNNIFNIDFYIGDVAKLVNNIKQHPELIVVDPPRAGLSKDTISYLNEFDPKKIIYVSCNPATMARDCALLDEYGYKVKSVKPFDLFPQTYHVENVCLLER